MLQDRKIEHCVGVCSLSPVWSQAYFLHEVKFDLVVVAGLQPGLTEGGMSEMKSSDFLPRLAANIVRPLGVCRWA